MPRCGTTSSIPVVLAFLSQCEERNGRVAQLWIAAVKRSQGCDRLAGVSLGFENRNSLIGRHYLAVQRPSNGFVYCQHAPVDID